METRKPFNNLRYADDTAVIGGIIVDIQSIVNEVGIRYGLVINVNQLHVTL